MNAKNREKRLTYKNTYVYNLSHFPLIKMKNMMKT